MERINRTLANARTLVAPFLHMSGHFTRFNKPVIEDPNAPPPDTLEALQSQIQLHQKVDGNRGLLDRITFNALNRGDEQSLENLKALEARAKQGQTQKGEITEAIKGDRSAIGTQDEWSHYGTGFLKAATLFLPGAKGKVPWQLVAAGGMHAVDQVKLNEDSTALSVVTDTAFGFAKGAGLKWTMDKASATTWRTWEKGLVIGGSGALIDSTLTKNTWMDQNGKFDPVLGAQRIFGSTAMGAGTGAVIFPVGHKMFKGISARTGGALERSPVLSNMGMGFSFGTTSGFTSEAFNQVQAGKFDPVQLVVRSLAQGGVDMFAGGAGTHGGRIYGVRPQPHPFAVNAERQGPSLMSQIGTGASRLTSYARTRFGFDASPEVGSTLATGKFSERGEGDRGDAYDRRRKGRDRDRERQEIEEGREEWGEREGEVETGQHDRGRQQVEEPVVKDPPIVDRTLTPERIPEVRAALLEKIAQVFRDGNEAKLPKGRDTTTLFKKLAEALESITGQKLTTEEINFIKGRDTVTQLPEVIREAEAKVRQEREQASRQVEETERPVEERPVEERPVEELDELSITDPAQRRTEDDGLSPLERLRRTLVDEHTEGLPKPTVVADGSKKVADIDLVAEIGDMLGPPLSRGNALARYGFMEAYTATHGSTAAAASAKENLARLAQEHPELKPAFERIAENHPDLKPTIAEAFKNVVAPPVEPKKEEPPRVKFEEIESRREMDELMDLTTQGWELAAKAAKGEPGAADALRDFARNNVDNSVPGSPVRDVQEAMVRVAEASPNLRQAIYEAYKDSLTPKQLAMFGEHFLAEAVRDPANVANLEAFIKNHPDLVTTATNANKLKEELAAEIEKGRNFEATGEREQAEAQQTVIAEKQAAVEAFKQEHPELATLDLMVRATDARPELRKPVYENFRDVLTGEQLAVFAKQLAADAVSDPANTAQFEAFLRAHPNPALQAEMVRSATTDRPELLDLVYNAYKGQLTMEELITIGIPFATAAATGDGPALARFQQFVKDNPSSTLAQGLQYISDHIPAIRDVVYETFGLADARMATIKINADTPPEKLDALAREWGVPRKVFEDAIAKGADERGVVNVRLEPEVQALEFAEQFYASRKAARDAAKGADIPPPAGDATQFLNDLTGAVRVRVKAYGETPEQAALSIKENLDRIARKYGEPEINNLDSIIVEAAMPSYSQKQYEALNAAERLLDIAKADAKAIAEHSERPFHSDGQDMLIRLHEEMMRVYENGGDGREILGDFRNRLELLAKLRGMENADALLPLMAELAIPPHKVDPENPDHIDFEITVGKKPDGYQPQPGERPRIYVEIPPERQSEALQSYAELRQILDNIKLPHEFAPSADGRQLTWNELNRAQQIQCLKDYFENYMQSRRALFDWMNRNSGHQRDGQPQPDLNLMPILLEWARQTTRSPVATMVDGYMPLDTNFSGKFDARPDWLRPAAELPKPEPERLAEEPTETRTETETTSPADNAPQPPSKNLGIRQGVQEMNSGDGNLMMQGAMNTHVLTGMRELTPAEFQRWRRIVEANLETDPFDLPTAVRLPYQHLQRLFRRPEIARMSDQALKDFLSENQTEPPPSRGRGGWAPEKDTPRGRVEMLEQALDMAKTTDMKRLDALERHQGFRDAQAEAAGQPLTQEKLDLLAKDAEIARLFTDPRAEKAPEPKEIADQLKRLDALTRDAKTAADRAAATEFGLKLAQLAANDRPLLDSIMFKIGENAPYRSAYKKILLAMMEKAENFDAIRRMMTALNGIQTVRDELYGPKPRPGEQRKVIAPEERVEAEAKVDELIVEAIDAALSTRPANPQDIQDTVEGVARNSEKYKDQGGPPRFGRGPGGPGGKPGGNFRGQRPNNGGGGGRP